MDVEDRSKGGLAFEQKNYIRHCEENEDAHKEPQHYVVMLCCIWSFLKKVKKREVTR
jgi:hypothetical protein